VTLRSRLTLLFLAAVQVTFLSATGAYWGIQSWSLVTDELTILHRQHARLDVVLDRVAARRQTVGADPRVRRALAALRRDAETVDESEHVTRLDAAIAAASPARTRHAVRRLADYYQGELRRLSAQGAWLARMSNWLLIGIVLLMSASFVGFLAAMRTWLVEPVRELERATEIMSTGDLSHRIARTGHGELARLATSINHMASSLAHVQARLVTRERFALLGELAAYVAHNIRNPLASIRATAQGEAIDLPADDPRRPAFEDIVVAVDRLDAWVGDLLRSVSPIALERRPGSVAALVERCVELARPRLRAGGIEVEFAVDATPDLSFDGAKLEQVVSAVLANATDASPSGGRIAVRIASDHEVMTLRIDDQGNGVPVNGRGNLFTPFSTSKASGTGLGLWLSQRIVVAHGGTIVLRDGERGGTTVEIRLPLVEPSPCRAS
jgi:signal transduction histidine kinase